MVARYLVNAQSISDMQFAELREFLKGITFLVSDIVNKPQTLDVTLNHNQTIEDLESVFPTLKECHITLIAL